MTQFRLVPLLRQAIAITVSAALIITTMPMPPAWAQFGSPAGGGGFLGDLGKALNPQVGKQAEPERPAPPATPEPSAKGSKPSATGSSASSAPARSTLVSVPSGFWIGVTTENARESLEVTDVLAGCPAAQAGIERGDRLTQLNDKPLRSLPPLLSAEIRAGKPDGEPYEVMVEGAGGTRTITFTPAAAAAEPQGLKVEVAKGEELGAELAVEDGGRRIAEVGPAGVLARANLRPGDAILHVDCLAVGDPQALETAFAKLAAGERERVTLGVERRERGRQLVTLVRAGAARQVAKQGPAKPIRIEAEAFTGLAGSAFYVEETTWPAVSGGKLVRMPFGQNRTGSIGTSLAPFGVEPGVYSVAVTFVDESDGSSHGTLRIGDATREWVFDRNTGGAGVGPDNLRTVSFDGIQIDADAELVLSATLDGEEGARIDFVELIPTDASGAPTAQVSIIKDAEIDLASAALGGALV
jgi:hypothetical protein